MKKEVLKKFIIVLLIALGINSAISCWMVSRLMLKDTEAHMQYVLSLLDSSLDYTKELQGQISVLPQVVDNEKARFTVIGTDGTVYADSDVEDVSTMPSHNDRLEVQEAVQKGNGYSIRMSDTLDTQMMYVTHHSKTQDYILRVGVPYGGLSVYVNLLLPPLFISFLLSSVIASITAARFAKTVTHPLREISREMLKMQQEEPEFAFREYPYPELNIIARITTRLSREIQKAIHKLEFEKTVRQEFFSNASHELKTPLTSVRGYVELIEGGIVTDEKQKKDFMKRIKKEVQNMTNLINDILMISKLETKEAEVVFTDVRMQPLIEDIIHSFDVIAKENQIEITSNCMPISIYANLQQMQELLTNLIGNAVKYNRPGGSVIVTIEKRENDLYLCVEDTGMGIPKESLERIFERFYRVDKGRSKKIGGTGLGLSIVKHIVKFYNGTIKLESTVDVGSKFSVYLPLDGVRWKEKEG